MAYTTIDDPSAYFQSILWTGNDTDGRALTNDGNSDLQPDLVWLKNRDVGYNHILTDSTRGVTKNIYSNSNGAEATVSNKVESFDTNGFTVGYDGSQVPNKSPRTFVAWQWKANGGTTSSNTSGTLTSTIQSDTTAGFCIATYTGNGTTGATYGHNLGVAPDIMFTKNLTSGSTDWSVDGSIAGLVYGTNKLTLNSSAAKGADTNNVTGASSTLITVGNGANCNQNASSHVAYLFAQKQGYSKFGKYVGNGSTNGPFVYTGFKPALIITKNADGTDGWNLLDIKRSTYNPANKYLQADNTNAEGTYTFYDILSNGFKIRNTGNANISGNNILFMAFAENPFVTSTGIPTTAR